MRKHRTFRQTAQFDNLQPNSPDKGYTGMDTSYTPVPYDFRETIEEAISKKMSGKIFFWIADQKVDEQAGTVEQLEDIPGKGRLNWIGCRNSSIDSITIGQFYPAITVQSSWK